MNSCLCIACRIRALFASSTCRLQSVHRLPHPCIIRFVDLQVTEKVEAMRELIEHHANAMSERAVIVVTRRRVRVRPANRPGRNGE